MRRSCRALQLLAVAAVALLLVLSWAGMSLRRPLPPQTLQQRDHGLPLCACPVLQLVPLLLWLLAAREEKEAVQQPDFHTH